MDFLGIGLNSAYKVNRPLNDQERADRLSRSRRISASVRDELSVIKINSTYLELIDRWYVGKGWATFFSIMLLPVSVSMMVMLLPGIWEEREHFMAWVAVIFMTSSGIALTWIGWRNLRVDVLRKSHYPIRLNRKTGKVHAWRPDGTILEANWKRLYFCVGESIVPAFGTTYDVRAHVLDKDRMTVLDTFTLAYCYIGMKSDVPAVWEYIRRYMEEPDGPEQNWRYSDVCLPVVGRKESFLFGVIYVFAQAGSWPVLQVILSPLWSAIAVCRWIAMVTCTVPVWPAEIEAQYVIEPDDPFQRDWRDNIKYNFVEKAWPIICFFIGLAVLVGGAWFVVDFFLSRRHGL